MASFNEINAGFPVDFQGGFGSIATFTLNQSTDAIEYIFQVPPGAASYTITRLGFRQGTLTGTAPIFRVSLQGVAAATGRADGTIKNSTNAFVLYTPTGGNNSTWQWVTLGATYAASPGEFLAMVIDYSSGTIDGSNNCTFTTDLSNTLACFPNRWTVDNSVGTRAQSLFVMGWGTAGTAYGAPLSTISALSFNSGSTPDEWACRFLAPTTNVIGFRYLSGGSVTAGTTITFALYSGTSVLQNVTIDTDFFIQSRTDSFYFDEASLSTLTIGNAYYLGMAPGSASNQGLACLDVVANADLAAYALGVDCYAASRTDAGAWTDLNTRRLWLEPILGGSGGTTGGSGVSRARAIAGT